MQVAIVNAVSPVAARSDDSNQFWDDRFGLIFPTSGQPETSGNNLRSLSISFSQEIIWFEVGMLWDANSFNHLQRIHFAEGPISVY